MHEFGSAFLLAAFALFGQSTPSAQAVEGKQVFNTSCAVGYCHGLNGRAGRGPRMRDRAWSKNYLYKTIEQGIPGSAMPAWQGRISKEKIAAVVSYILSISKEQPESESEPVHASLSASATTDSPGKALFFDLSRDRNCGVCHRVAGAGATVAAPFTSFQGIPARVLLAKILAQPTAESSVAVRLTDGEQFCGIKAAADSQYLRVYDLGGAGPPVLRTLVLRTIDKQSVQSVTPCPSLNVHARNTVVYSSPELQSIVDFLMRKSAPE
jgi:mono/diheme cytochrome c family protein